MHSQSNAPVKEKYSFKTKLCIETAARKLHKPKITSQRFKLGITQVNPRKILPKDLTGQLLQ